MLLSVRAPSPAYARELRQQRDILQALRRTNLWILYVAGITAIYSLYCVATWSLAIIATKCFGRLYGCGLTSLHCLADLWACGNYSDTAWLVVMTRG
jgi:hypothetical protein